MRFGELRGRRDVLHGFAQPFVHRRHAAEKVQNPLVDAQRTRSETLPTAHFDEPPPPQRCRGNDGAPVSLGEQGERQPKRWCRPCPFLCGGQQRRHLSVQIHCGAKEQQVAFETRQAQSGAQLFQRRRRAHGDRRFTGRFRVARSAAIGLRSVLGRRSVSSGRKPSLEQAADHTDRDHQVPLVEFCPARLRACSHGSVTVGPKVGLP